MGSVRRSALNPETGACGRLRTMHLKGIAMKAWSRTLIAIVFFGLWLAAPQVGAGAPDTGSAPAPVSSQEAQGGGAAWIVWETQAPVQRLALDGDWLWVGYQGAGLARWDRETGPQAAYTSADGLPGDDVLSIVVDSSGNKWIATLVGGVARTDSGESFADLTPGAPADHNAWALATHGSDVWLGTLGGGLAHRSGGAWSIDTAADSSLPFDDIYAVAVEPSGTAWVGTLGYGVAAHQAGVWTTYDPPLTIASPLNSSTQVSNHAITDIAVDGAGNKWFATDGSGVARLDSSNANWTVYDTSNSGLSSDFVQSVFIDGAGNKWFGTLDGGVSRLGSGGGWTTYDSGNTPLPEDDVLDLAVDGDGGLWLAAYDTGLAYFGGLPATPPSFNMDPMGEPATPPGSSRGYDLWLDPATYRWTLAWHGDGQIHAFQGEVYSEAPITLVGTDDFESGDEASADGDTLSIDAHESDGQDSLTFQLDRSATELMVALRIDGAYFPFSIRVGAGRATPGTAPFRLAALQPQPPVVDAGPDLTLTEGDFAFFAGAFTDPDSPSGQTSTWDFGDGSTASDMLSPSHVYVDNGSYTATLTVTDVHGMVGTDSLAVSVENAPPEVDLFTEPFSPNVGESVDFEAVIFDPGPADTHTYEWRFGDGSYPVTTADPTTSHTFDQSGDYMVGVTVTDDDGGEGEAGFTLTVSGNQAPQIAAGADAAVDEGAQFARSVTFTDGDSASWDATVDYGDGSTVETVHLDSPDDIPLDHVYPQDGAFDVTVTVIDDEDAEGTATFTLTVNNVAPEINLLEELAIPEGTDLAQEGSFTDPGTEDTWTATVDYGLGDGPQPLTLDEMTFELHQVYADLGPYDVTVCVMDDDEASCKTLQLTVQDVTPPTTTIEIGDEPNTAGWYNAPPIPIGLTSVDNHEVQTLFYKPENGEGQQGHQIAGNEASFDLAEGRWTVWFQAQDAAGNMEALQSAPVWIDGTPLEVTASLSGDLGESDWYVSPVQVTLAADDPDLADGSLGSGLAAIEYSLDDGDSWETYAGPFGVDRQGETSLRYQARDMAGNLSDGGSESFRIDTVPPTVTATASGTSGAHGWYTSDVSVALAASDAASGVVSLEYKLGTGDWILYSVPVVVESQGQTELQYRATDEAGNRSAPDSLTVMIDTVAPTASADVAEGVEGENGWYTSGVSIELSASDTTSGVNRIEYRLNEADDWQTYSDSVLIEDDGKHLLHYRAVDGAGNTSDVGVLEVRIDTTSPEASLTIDPSELWPPNNKPFEVHLQGPIDDAASGLGSVALTIEDEYDEWEPTIDPLTFDGDMATTLDLPFDLMASRKGGDKDDRVYTIHITVTDAAGQQAYDDLKVLVLHDEKGKKK